MRAPASTYRLQLHAGFDLRAVESVADYLDQLGVDWLYLSPLLAARRGSPHGYDIVDPTRLNPALGSELDLERLARRASERGRGILLDIVPNHLAADESNVWWMDVLSFGPASCFASVFDIDWELGGGKLLLPLLGDELDAVLERAELRVGRDAGKLWLRYFERRLPLRDPESLIPPGDLPTLGHAELRRLLDAQAYELRYFRDARPLNYRRFFTISDLVGVRVEDEHVFSRTHDTTLSWLARGYVSGLRVDHPDGLLDPAGYLERLAAAAEGRYIVVEKILNGNEALSENWPVHGTTGYEQLNRVARLFVDPAGEQPLWALYRHFTGHTEGLKEVVVRSKRLVLESSLAPEVDALADRAHALCADRGVGLDEIREALIAIIACFHVYRSYVRPSASAVDGEDRRLLEQAVARARQLAPDVAQAAFDGWACILLLDPPLLHDAASRERALALLLRFQQLTGPAAAKGVEDTAFYRFHPLASLAEVGGEPDAFGIDVTTFHEHNALRARRFPHALSASSTHDTKRSEDVRARISVLSEVPERWAEAVQEFSQINRAHKTMCGGELAPDANDEYLLYQTLVGSFPLDGTLTPEYGQRLLAYALKAIRESKRHTRWIQPDEPYERATHDFVAALVDAQRGRQFLERFRAFAAPLVRPGLLGALSQLVIKLASPGAADFYQGTELWDDSLVDPDNRRAIDFELRRRLLDELARRARPAELLERIEDGRLKLWVTLRGLRWRREQKKLFTSGAYHQLATAGPRADQVVALLRRDGAEAAVGACGRFFTRFDAALPVGAAWTGTVVELGSEFPIGRYENVFSGEMFVLGAGQVLAASELFATLPVALLKKLP